MPPAMPSMATSPTAMSPMRRRRRKAASGWCSSAAPPRSRSRTPSTTARSTAPSTASSRNTGAWRRPSTPMARSARSSSPMAAGASAGTMSTGFRPSRPRRLRELVHRSFPAEMEDHDIRRIVRRLCGGGARRARDGDLDGVEISTQAGTLIEQFWSPAMNLRTDGYGGSLRQSHALWPRGSRSLPRGGGRRLPDRHPHAGRRDAEGRPDPRRLHRDRARPRAAPASSISSASSAALRSTTRRPRKSGRPCGCPRRPISSSPARSRPRSPIPVLHATRIDRCRDRRSCGEGRSISTWSA